MGQRRSILICHHHYLVLLKSLPGTPYPVYRLGVIMVGLACAIAIHIFVSRTRIGAMVRAGADNRK